MNFEFHTHSEIVAALKSQLDEITALAESVSDKTFKFNIPGKWSIAKNIEHLGTANNITAVGFITPKPVLKIIAGGATSQHRSANQIASTYLLKVAEGAKSPVLYLPKPIPGLGKSVTINIWKFSVNNLMKAISSWSDSDLDVYQLPHPILGKISAREMLFFTVFHNYFHLNTMKALVIYAQID